MKFLRSSSMPATGARSELARIKRSAQQATAATKRAHNNHAPTVHATAAIFPCCVSEFERARVGWWSARPVWSVVSPAEQHAAAPHPESARKTPAATSRQRKGRESDDEDDDHTCAAVVREDATTVTSAVWTTLHDRRVELANRCEDKLHPERGACLVIVQAILSTHWSLDCASTTVCLPAGCYLSHQSCSSTEVVVPLLTVRNERRPLERTACTHGRMLFKSRMTCRLPSRAAALLLLLAVLVACLGTSASMVGSRGANSAHTTRFLRKVEPLSSFHVTHDGDDEGGIAKPLAGFHPDAPPVAPPVQRTTPEIEEEEEVDANSDEDHDKHAPSVTTDSSASWSELRTDGKYTAADLAHWSVGGAPHAYHDGRAQLFPDGVQLHFTALGESFSLDLRIMRDLFVPGSEGGATVMDADGRVIGTHPHVLQSYWSSLPNGGWATATLHRDGRFQAVVHRDGDTIQVDPVRAHQADMSPTQFVRLHRASHTPDADGAERRGMVVHRHSDLVDLSLTHRLAMVDVVNVSSTERRRDVRHEDVQEESLRPFVATSFASSTSTRRAMHTTGFAHKTHPAPPRPAGASPFPSSDGGWTDCYSGDHAPHRVSVGFAVDAGMYEALGSSVAAVQQHIASQVAVANLVFLPQLHVYLTVADIVIFTAPTTNGTDNDSPVWNERPTVRGERTCATEIGPKLTAFSKWRAAVHPRRNALWNLQTNCYPPAGAVGLAWTGVLCDEAFGASVSSYTSQQWLTTTHELGEWRRWTQGVVGDRGIDTSE